MHFLYLGPGIDGGVITIIFAFLVSLVTFLVAIIWYPLKKIIHFFKNIGRNH